MKLVSIVFENFRCYLEKTEILIDDLTCLIGKNDIGKSTVIEGLLAFFNDTIDKGDLSTTASDSTIKITCKFSDLPEEIVIDTSLATTFEDEYIVNEDGLLEIRKEYDIGRSIKKSVYLVANHPIDSRIIDILSKKNGSLKLLAEEENISLDGINRSKNPLLRKTIRNSIGGEIGVVNLKIDGNLTTENNLKTFWTTIKKLLPVFSLFKVDKNIDDKDKDIQDPMKTAIQESLAMPKIIKMLEAIEIEVKKSSSEIADRTIEKLKDIDASLAEKMKSDFSKDPGWEKIFDLTLLNEQGIPLNKRGSGIKRLVLLSFFQAQAERKKQNDDAPSIIYAIEEPETSQHPNHQKMLINALVEISEQDNYQVIFTTHSSNLVREIPISSMRYISKLEDELSVDLAITDDQLVDESVLKRIITTLGVLPNPSDRIKVLVYLEGNHDIEALKRYSHIISTHDKDILNLDSEEVGFIISGGSALKFYIDNKYLSGLGKPEVHIYDNDVEDYRKYVAKVNEEMDENKIAYNTNKLELENYLSKDAIIEAYSEHNIDIELPEITDSTNVPLLVAMEVHSKRSPKKWDELSDEKKKYKESKAKRILNSLAVDKMNIERIHNRNAYEEICIWLNKIKDYTKN